MIIEKEVSIKGFKGYGGFCIMDKRLERFADPNKKQKVKIEIMEDNDNPTLA